MAFYSASQETINPPDSRDKVGEVVQWVSLDSKESIMGTKSTRDRKIDILPRLRQRRVESNGPPRVWNPSWLQSQSLSGIIAVAIAVGAMFAALAVLLVSNGQRVSSWRIQPTVYLAIASAVGVSALRFAKGKATPISWWHTAYRGSTIASLESHWEESQSLVGAVNHFKYARWVSCSTVLYLLMIIDGAMLQRASTVVLTNARSQVSLNFQMAPELPTGFSGIFHLESNVYSNAVTAVSHDTWHDIPMRLEARGCDDSATCNAKVFGPGVSMQHCNTTVWPISKEMLGDANATWGPYHSMWNSFMINPALQIVIGTAWSGDNDTSKRENGWLLTGRAEWTAQGGSYTQTNCSLIPAILEYDVQFSGGRVTLQSPEEAKVIALANNTVRAQIYNPVDVPDTMSALLSFAEVTVAANASAAFPLPANPGEYWAPLPASFDLQVAKHIDLAASAGALDLKFRDPGPSVLGTVNSMLFRGGIMAGSWSNTSKLMDPGLSTNQTVQGRQEDRVNVFQSDLRWFAGAAILDLVAILAILPLFWGFWRLPRNVTRSPFGLALAFDAPLLEGVHSTAGAEGVVKDMGEIRVAFGLVRDQSNPFVNREELRHGNSPSVGRLGIGDTRQVIKPQLGTQFAE